MAFLDSDEFLCLLEGDSLVDFLKNYEEFGGLSLSWFMFGTSNIPKLSSNKLIIEQLTFCLLPNIQELGLLKCIVQPKYVKNFENPHYANFVDNYFPVNPNKESLIGYEKGKGPALFNKLRINHYWTRDEDYFWKIKIPRQIQLHGQTDTAMFLYTNCNLTQDFGIQKFVPALRKRMRLMKSK